MRMWANRRRAPWEGRCDARLLRETAYGPSSLRQNPAAPAPRTPKATEGRDSHAWLYTRVPGSAVHASRRSKHALHTVNTLQPPRGMNAGHAGGRGSVMLTRCCVPGMRASAGAARSRGRKTDGGVRHHRGPFMLGRGTRFWVETA